jgi:hypothetical protein
MESFTAYGIRAYRKQDLASLGPIYSSSIRYRGAEFYSESQIAAWASFSQSSEEFQHWIEAAKTFVAIADDGQCIGFSGLLEGAHISAVFCVCAIPTERRSFQPDFSTARRSESPAYLSSHYACISVFKAALREVWFRA